eukprot:gnl/Trimastix_PCT/4259.p1 GENE.gnl/Trimastix_PCT/4259~~gnl/Trimastix_PCT/4259.p1  ORF type:complete len:1215 (+),score=377.13 gnl/Trimastix_PCT/4259:68-3712(+)
MVRFFPAPAPPPTLFPPIPPPARPFGFVPRPLPRRRYGHAPSSDAEMPVIPTERFSINPKWYTELPVADQPVGLRVRMFMFQRRSLAFMQNLEDSISDYFPVKTRAGSELYLTARGGLLADEMGLGKTLSMIALVHSRPAPPMEPKLQKPAMTVTSRATLVVCPNQLCQQWYDEVKRFCPGMKAYMITKQSDHRKVSYEKAASADIIIVSYNFMRGQYYMALPTLAAEKEKSTVRTSTRRSRTSRSAELTDAEVLQRPCPDLHSISWHRLIVDECHEITSRALGTNSGEFNTLAGIPHMHFWCVTGTPFPYGRQSVNDLCRLISLADETGKRCLSHEIDFDSLASTFFIRNEKLTVTEELGIPMFDETSYLLRMTKVEDAFYRTQFDRLRLPEIRQPQRSDVARDPPDIRIYERPQSVLLRQLCCHPQVGTEFHAMLGDAALSMDELRRRMIGHKEDLIRRLRKRSGEIDRERDATQAKLDKLKEPKKEDYAESDLADGGDDASSDSEGEGRFGRGGFGFGFGGYGSYFGRERKYEKKLRVYRQRKRRYEIRLERFHKEYDEGQRTMQDTARSLRYFTTVIDALVKAEEKEALKATATATATTDAEKAGADGGHDDDADDLDADPRDCPICYEELQRPCMTECAHFFCTQCLQNWMRRDGGLGYHGNCPVCRRPIRMADVIKFDLPKAARADEGKADGPDLFEYEPDECQGFMRHGERFYEVDDALLNKYGTKLAHLIRYMKAVIAQQESAKFIVFSEWHTMLVLVGKALAAYGIPCVFCEGNVSVRNKAIAKFRDAGNNIRAIMLSLTHGASGTNLMEASHIILIEPVGGGEANADGIEMQAIGRAYRLGQARAVEVVRFVMRNTVEHDLHALCRKSRMRRTDVRQRIREQQAEARAEEHRNARTEDVQDKVVERTAQKSLERRSTIVLSRTLSELDRMLAERRQEDGARATDTTTTVTTTTCTASPPTPTRPSTVESEAGPLALTAGRTPERRASAGLLRVASKLSTPTQGTEGDTDADTDIDDDEAPVIEPKTKRQTRSMSPPLPLPLPMPEVPTAAPTATATATTATTTTSRTRRVPCRRGLRSANVEEEEDRPAPMAAGSTRVTRQQARKRGQGEAKEEKKRVKTVLPVRSTRAKRARVVEPEPESESEEETVPPLPMTPPRPTERVRIPCISPALASAVCPVCGKDVSHLGNEEVNKHLDECLNSEFL